MTKINRLLGEISFSQGMDLFFSRLKSNGLEDNRFARMQASREFSKIWDNIFFNKYGKALSYPKMTLEPAEFNNFITEEIVFETLEKIK